MFMNNTQIYLQILGNTCGSISQKLGIRFFHVVSIATRKNSFSYIFREYRKRTVV